MAAQVVRRIGRQSRAIELTAEGPVVSIPEAMAAARQAVRADAQARQLGREPDTIVNAIVTLEYATANGPQLYHMRLPVGQTPLGARGDGADTAIRVLQQGVQNRLETMETRESGIAVRGVRGVRLYMNAGSQMLARGIQGGAWTVLPEALANKKACINIQNEDHRCLIYSICAFMLDKDGRLPKNPHLVSHYQVGKPLANGKRSNSVFVPLNVGLDFTAIDVRGVDITDQLLEFEETNDLGVYIYAWEEKQYGHGVTLGRPRIIRTPDRLHKLECIVLLHKKHYVYVRDFQRLMACNSEQVVRTTRRTAAIKYCHRCNRHFNTQPLRTERLKTCNPWALELQTAEDVPSRA